MFSEKQHTIDGALLNVATSLTAAGPPLLMLHGVLRQWSDFLAVGPALASRWHLVGLDFRGHGKSDRAAGRYAVADYVADAAAVLRELIHEPAVIFGHSLGAMVAAAAAAQNPKKVCGLILEDPPFHTMGSRIAETVFLSQFMGIQSLLGQPTTVPELALRLANLEITSPGGEKSFRLGDVRDPASLRYHARCLTLVDPKVLQPIISGQWLAGFDFEHVLQHLKCPTLVLQGNGEKGGMLTELDAARLKGAISDCSIVRFANVGHLIHSTATEDALRVVVPFLESLR